MTSFLRSRMASLNCISVLDNCELILSFSVSIEAETVSLFVYFSHLFKILHRPFR